MTIQELRDFLAQETTPNNGEVYAFEGHSGHFEIAFATIDEEGDLILSDSEYS